VTTTELQQAHLDAHNARVEARLIRAGMADRMLGSCVRLLEGEMDVDAAPEVIDAMIASWRVYCTEVFIPAQAVTPSTTRAPGVVFGAAGAAEAARRSGSPATQQVSGAPTGRVFGPEGVAEAARRYPGGSSSAAS